MKVCSIEGCGESHSAKGLCRRHYYQQLRGWTPLATRGMSLESRIAHYTSPSGECCEWVGAKNKGGYGLVSVNNKRRLVTHVVWELAFGPIPERLHVLHRCDNPACVRPAHLFVGTHATNMKDREEKKRTKTGRDSHLATLSAQQVENIKAASGTQREIAARFGVSQGTVSNIKRGWKHYAPDVTE